MGHKHIAIPNLSLACVSLPFLLMPCLRLIRPLLRQSIEQEIPVIRNNLSILKNISETVAYDSNVAKRIASFLHNRTVFCFTSPYLLSEERDPRTRSMRMRRCTVLENPSWKHLITR